MKEELKRIDKVLENYENLNKKLDKYLKVLENDNKIEDYKQRNEKAIEYINKLSNEPNAFGHYGIDGNCKKYLLKILKGDKDE